MGRRGRLFLHLDDLTVTKDPQLLSATSFVQYLHDISILTSTHCGWSSRPHDRQLSSSHRLDRTLVLAKWPVRDPDQDAGHAAAKQQRSVVINKGRPVGGVLAWISYATTPHAQAWPSDAEQRKTRLLHRAVSWAETMLWHLHQRISTCQFWSYNDRYRQ